MDKLDFDMWLIAEHDIEYDEFQQLSKQEKKRIKDEYHEYVGGRPLSGME